MFNESLFTFLISIKNSKTFVHSSFLMIKVCLQFSFELQCRMYDDGSGQGIEGSRYHVYQQILDKKLAKKSLNVMNSENTRESLLTF